MSNRLWDYIREYWSVLVEIISLVLMQGLASFASQCITINPELVSPIKAPNTKRTQTMTQASIAVRPSALGMFVVIVLKILTRTRNTVINRVILKKE